MSPGPSRIRTSAARELRHLSRDRVLLKVLITDLVRIATDPAGCGTPIGPVHGGFYRRIPVHHRVIVYSVDGHGTLVVEGIRKGVGV